MLKIIKELLANEKSLVFAERAKGNFIIRPTSILAVIFSLLYLCAPIDILPEGIIEPMICGFIDDIIVLCIMVYIVYLDIGGELDGYKALHNGKVSKKKKSNRKDRVRPRNEFVHECADVSDSDIDMHDSDDAEENTTNSTSNVDDNTNVSSYNDYGIGDSEERDDEEVYLNEESSFRL